MASAPRYRRVLLKISGEALCAPGGFGLDPQAVADLVGEIRPVVQMGVAAGLVVGGGNFLRGKALSSRQGLPRATADAMGMLATIMNGLALREALDARDVPARVLSAIPTGGLCDDYDRRLAGRLLDEGHVVILAGGTGSPFFTTDTCAALRAAELDADALLKATQVDGVFDSDPASNPDASKFDRLSYAEVLARRLGVMDLAAVSLCMESAIPIIVFHMATTGNLAAAVRGETVGTIVTAN